MEAWKEKFSSGKFLLCLGSLMIVIGSYVAGQIDSTALITGVITAVGTWQFSEAAVDAAAVRGS